MIVKTHMCPGRQAVEKNGLQMSPSVGGISECAALCDRRNRFSMCLSAIVQECSFSGKSILYICTYVRMYIDLLYISLYWCGLGSKRKSKAKADGIQQTVGGFAFGIALEFKAQVRKAKASWSHELVSHRK